MNNILEYKGFYGSSEVSIEDDVLFGQLLFICDLVTYEADNVSELKVAFEDAVDDYIAFCKKHGKEPEKPCKGTFNVRVSPALHRASVIEAKKRNISLNQFVADCLEKGIQSRSVESQEHQTMNQRLDMIDASFQQMNNNFLASTQINYAVVMSLKKEMIVNG